MEITKPGKYVLNKNIIISRCEFEGINISSDNVSLDLNGYSISSDGSGIAIKIRGNGINIYNGQISKTDIAFLFVSGYNVVINDIIVSDVNKVLSGEHVENLNVKNLTAAVVKDIFLDIKYLISSSLSHLNVTKTRIFAVLTRAKPFLLKNSQIYLLNSGAFILTSTTEDIEIDIQIEKNRVTGEIVDKLPNFFSLKGKSFNPVKVLIQDNFFDITGTFKPPFDLFPVTLQTGFYFENVSAPKTVIFRKNVLIATNMTAGFVSLGALAVNLPPSNDSILVSDNEFHLSGVFIGIIYVAYEISQGIFETFPLPFSLSINNNKILGSDNNDLQNARNGGIIIESAAGVNISNNEITSFVDGMAVESNSVFLDANTISNCYIGFNNFGPISAFGRENKVFNCEIDTYGPDMTYLATIPPAP